MKKFVLLLACFSLFSIGSGHAQSLRNAQAQYPVKQLRSLNTELLRGAGAGTADKVYSFEHGVQLPASITLPTGNLLPTKGTFPQQGNGRPLHNIQVDPSNPMNVHAVVTGNLDLTKADTVTSGGRVIWGSRRVFYTFSSDGGVTWKAPVTLGTVKSGYADLQLLNRNGTYVPVIAAHELLAANSANLSCLIWLEKGAPGDGKFAECKAGRHPAYDQNPKDPTIDLLWPVIAISSDNKKVYMVASIQSDTGQLEFGSFSFSTAYDTATWNGWTALPGAGDPNNANAGWATGGDYRIRVAANGNVGILWKNTDIGGASGTGVADEGLYFAESTDGGKTWPTTLQAIVPLGTPQTIGTTQATLAPTTCADFWYDGSSPKFYWMAYFEDYSSNDPKSVTYFPSTSTFFFWNPSVSANALDIASTGLTGTLDSMKYVVHALNETPYIDQQGPPLNQATIGRTSDSNHFALFFQTFANDDSVMVKTDTQYMFGSIYKMETNDAGLSWSLSSPFLSNAGVALKNKIDYRYPQISDWNPITGNKPVYHVLFSADSAPGQLGTTGAGGDPTFSVISYGHATYAPGAGAVRGGAATSSLSIQNYPNPSASSTTITYSVASESNALLTIEDMLGRPVATLVNGRVGAGEHQVVFNASELSAGIYRYTLRVGTESVTKSMSILK